MTTLWAPNSGSSIVSSGSVIGSTKKPIWLSLMAGGGAGSAIIYDDTASTAGREILQLGAPNGENSPQFGPFVSSCALYVAGISNASVFAWARR